MELRGCTYASPHGTRLEFGDDFVRVDVVFFVFIQRAGIAFFFFLTMLTSPRACFSFLMEDAKRAFRWV